MTRRASLYIAVLAFWIGSPALAAVLLSDSFDYPDGALVSVSGATWSHLANGGGTTGEVAVISGSVQLEQTRGEDVFALIGGQPYSANGPTNVFYASFKANFTALPGAGGAYFAHFKDSSQIYRARVWALTNGAAPGGFRLGLSLTNASFASVTNPSDCNLNTRLLVVTRLECSNSAASLWINPQSESDPSVSIPATSSGSSVVAYSFREAPGDRQPPYG